MGQIGCRTTIKRYK